MVGVRLSLLLIVLLATWEAIVRVFRIQELVLPAPSAIASDVPGASLEVGDLVLDSVSAMSTADGLGGLVRAEH